MVKDIMMSVLKILFPSIRYVCFFGVCAIAVLVSLIWIPHYESIYTFLSLDYVSVGAKLGFLFALLGSFTTNFTCFGMVQAILVSLLVSANIVAFSIYYQASHNLILGSRIAGAGILGFVFGLLGVGCSACGSILAFYLLSLTGGGALLSVLPFGGIEFSIVSLIILCVSLAILLKNMRKTNVC